jgi:hypothetical protein
MIRGAGRVWCQILIWSSVGRAVSVGDGSSRVIVPDDIIGINTPGLRRIINLEILDDLPLYDIISKVIALVYSS